MTRTHILSLPRKQNRQIQLAALWATSTGSESMLMKSRSARFGKSLLMPWLGRSTMTGQDACSAPILLHEHDPRLPRPRTAVRTHRISPASARSCPSVYTFFVAKDASTQILERRGDQELRDEARCVGTSASTGSCDCYGRLTAVRTCHCLFRQQNR